MTACLCEGIWGGQGALPVGEIRKGFAEKELFGKDIEEWGEGLDPRAWNLILSKSFNLFMPHCNNISI